MLLMSDAADKDPRIARAIEACGTQAALAAAIGVKQQTISKLLNRERPISGEIAARIHRATGGRVSRHELRPDLFEASASVAGAAA